MVTGRPVVGVSALDALRRRRLRATGCRHARIGSWMDAARGEIFAAAYDAWGEAGGAPDARSADRARGGSAGSGLGSLEGLDAESRVGPQPWAPGRSRRSRPRLPWVFTGDGATRYAAVLGDASGRGRAATGALHRAIGPAHGGRGPLTRRTHLQPLYVRRPDAERGQRPHDRGHRRRTPSRGPADLDAVLAIEEASFNNPTTRAWYEAELAAAGGLQSLRHPHRRSTPCRRVLRASGRWSTRCTSTTSPSTRTWRGRGLGTRLLAGVLAAAAGMGGPPGHARSATLEPAARSDSTRRLASGWSASATGYYAQPVEDALVLSHAVESPESGW